MRMSGAAFGELRGRLTQFAINLDMGITEAAGSGARLVAADAISLAPVKTGRLRRSITTAVGQDGANTEGVVQATAPYAAYVEYGTGVFGPKRQPIVYDHLLHVQIRPGVWVSMYGQQGMAGKPFMRPAWRATLPRVVDGFIQAIRDALGSINE